MSLSEKFILIEGLLLLTFSKCAVDSLPRRWLLPIYGIRDKETPEQLAPEQESKAKKIAYLLHLLDQYLPWHSTCLMDAVASKIMLSRRAIPSTMYIGFRHEQTDKESALYGHTWVRSGSQYVSGIDHHLDKNYKIITFYGSHS
jgi:hypothetical protein